MSLADGFFPISFLSDTASTGVLVIISGRIVNIRGEKGLLVAQPINCTVIGICFIKSLPCMVVSSFLYNSLITLGCFRRNLISRSVGSMSNI